MPEPNSRGFFTSTRSNPGLMSADPAIRAGHFTRSDARLGALADTEVRAMLSKSRVLRRLVRRCAVPRPRRLRSPRARSARGAPRRSRRPGPGSVPHRVSQVGGADRRPRRAGLLVPDRPSRRQQRSPRTRPGAGARARDRAPASGCLPRAVGDAPPRCRTPRAVPRRPAGGPAIGLRAVGDRGRAGTGDRPAHGAQSQHGLRPRPSAARPLARPRRRDDRARAVGAGAAALGLCQRSVRGLAAGASAGGSRC